MSQRDQQVPNLSDTAKEIEESLDVDVGEAEEDEDDQDTDEEDMSNTAKKQLKDIQEQYDN